MKKGFTLVELLAVLSLLALLSLVIVPVIDKLIKENKENLYQEQVKNIEDGTRNWAAANIFSLPEEINGSLNKTICDLEKTGFLEVDMKNPKTGELFNKDSFVKITKTINGFEYDYQENSGTISATCE